MGKTGTMKTKFNFYDNVLAVSLASKPIKGEIKSDLMLTGNLTTITQALIEHMNRHPVLAQVVAIATATYCKEHPEFKTDVNKLK